MTYGVKIAVKMWNCKNKPQGDNEATFCEKWVKR